MIMAENFEEEFLDDSVIDIRTIEVQPFMFEPMPGSNDRHHSSSSEWETESEEQEEDVNPERIGNTDW